MNESTTSPDRSRQWSIALIVGFVVALLLNFVELENITGLPAHPLLLHMPVIFIPLLAVAAVVFAVKPDWRRRFSIAYGIGAIVTLAGTVLAVGAGEAWKESREGSMRGGGFPSGAGPQSGIGSSSGGTPPSAGDLPSGAAPPSGIGGPRGAGDSTLAHHASLGSTLRIVVIVFALLILIQVLADLGAFEKLKSFFADARSAASVTLSVLLAALALAAGGLTYATGHAGAEAAFGNEGFPGGGAAQGSQSPGGTGSDGQQGQRGGTDDQGGFGGPPSGGDDGYPAQPNTDDGTSGNGQVQ
jgi:uncharacterized membrane protein YhdT